VRLCMATPAVSHLRTGEPHSLRLERLGQKPDDHGQVLALVVRREDDRVLVAGYRLASETVQPNGLRSAMMGGGRIAYVTP
jgi:hypothetical protein